MSGQIVSALEYRDAMARYGAAVSIVTTKGADGPSGFTASAICSVTDEPPTLLVCMNRSASQHRQFINAKILCVNALTAGQQDLSGIFAGGRTMAERFAAAKWDVMTTGAPVLVDALVSFDCRITSHSDIGTHSVFFCAVEAVRHGPAREGLMYFGRAYHRLEHK